MRIYISNKLLVTTGTDISTRSAALQETQQIGVCRDGPAKGHTYAHHVTVEAVLQNAVVDVRTDKVRRCLCPHKQHPVA
jgi:hypothetical protein